MIQLTCARLVTFVYLKLTQILILKVFQTIQSMVYNITASVYALVHVMDEICPTEVEGCFGLFWVVFLTCPIKTTPRRTLQAFVLWHKNKATQYVIKLFSEIIDAQCLTNKLAPLANLGRIDRSVLSGRTEGMIDLYYRVARKEWSIDRSVDNPPPQFSVGRSVDFILCQFLTFVWEATWFLHASQLCACPKLNYPATQPGCTSI